MWSTLFLFTMPTQKSKYCLITYSDGCKSSAHSDGARQFYGFENLSTESENSLTVRQQIL
jgi:hypothetical protein